MQDGKILKNYTSREIRILENGNDRKFSFYSAAAMTTWNKGK